MFGMTLWDDPLTIQFQLHRREYHLSYLDLALLMGLYRPEYTSTKEYHNLISSPPLVESQRIRCRRLSNSGLLFRLSLTTSTTLKSPALQIIHMFLSSTITGQIHGTNFIASSKFKYLLRMVNQTPYHFSFLITNSCNHQATHTRVRIIFSKSYITRLIRGIGLLEDMDHMLTVGATNLFFSVSYALWASIYRRPSVTLLPHLQSTPLFQF